MANELVGRKFVGFTGAASGYQDVSLSSLTGGLASSPSAGDHVFVARVTTRADVDQTFAIRDTSDVNYTNIADLYANDTNDSNLHVGVKVMGGTPDTSVRIDESGSTASALVVAIEVWRGCNTTTLQDVAAVTSTGTNTGRPNPGSITPVTPGTVILTFGSGTSATDFTSSDYDNFNTLGQTETSGLAVVGVGEKAWTSGAFDAAQWGGSNTSTQSSWCACVIAVRRQPNAYSLAANAASFVLTGTAAALRYGRFIAASAGAFVLTGADAGLKAGRKLTASAASFVLTGADAGLKAGRKIAADAGAFALAGAAASFVRGRTMVADAGAFVLTGAAATLSRGSKMVADGAAFVLTGASAGLSVVRKLVASAGAFAVSFGTTYFRLPPPFERTSASVRQHRSSRSVVQYRSSASSPSVGSRSETQDRSSASVTQDRSSKG